MLGGLRKESKMAVKKRQLKGKQRNKKSQSKIKPRNTLQPGVKIVGGKNTPIMTPSLVGLRYKP